MNDEFRLQFFKDQFAVKKIIEKIIYDNPYMKWLVHYSVISNLPLLGDNISNIL